MDTVDVVVVGAGPAGCMIAGELASFGKSVVVLEKHEAMSPLSRAFGVHARTLEVLDTRGLAQDLLKTGARVDALKLWDDTYLDMSVLPSPFPFLLSTPQTNVDSLLETHATYVGADVRRGVTVTAIEQDESFVTVTAVECDGTPVSWRASYVVGADGVRSIVREKTGQQFHGRALLRSIMLADVKLTDPPVGLVNVDAGKDCFAFVAPFGGDWYRVVAWDRNDESEDEDPIDEEVLRSVLVRAMGTDYGWQEVRWTSRFRCEERQVNQYRTGRVFLVGDAAHVHSPAGGQGMNTGIQDSLNLGWKLAAVIDGADDTVLDTYHVERYPVGKRVIRMSGGTMRMLLVQSSIAKRMRNTVVDTVLRRPRLASKIAVMFSGVGIAYGHRRGEHRLVGTRAPDVPTATGRLFEDLRRPGFVLVLEKDSGAAGFAGHVTYRRDDGPAMLVRPDGYVAWAGASASGDWQSVLARWTGQSSSSASSGASSRVAMPPSLPSSVGPGRPPFGSSSE
ncbi:pentachlorophenol monooxygenase [Rhodococcoides kyotonense]|uniref:Pentachlorophenol monooxygenase n=1 Tax=Rhodococcoides kyotonense TaxID=398843 RepID=A0A239DUL8_9NOCA|nr:pentachlorophenol monooxygenase [Rhodococcus kyotonensis]